jgi:hypothetical protein
MNSSMRNATLLSGLLLLLAGCTGSTLEVGDGGAARNDAAPSSTAPETGTGLRPLDSFTAAQVQTAVAACSAVHGTVTPLPTPEAVLPLLEGSWYDCDGATTDGLDLESATFDGAGNWHDLLPDGSGGLVEGLGLKDTATYDVFSYDDGSDSCADSGCGINLKGVDVVQLGVAFEMSPTRMLLGGQSGHWFVPLGS